MSCDAGQSASAAAPAYYNLSCEGCNSVIGAKPATMSTKAVTDVLDSEAEESKQDNNHHERR